jgi:hypothetical protein
MCNNVKRAKNDSGSGGGSNQNPSNPSVGFNMNNQGQADQGNQSQGYQNQGNQGNQGGYQGSGKRGKYGGNQNPRNNSNQGRGSGRNNRYNPPQGSNGPPQTGTNQPQGTTMGLEFENSYVDMFNHINRGHEFDTSYVDMLTHDEPSLPVPIRREFLHDPSVLPSNHLNVTVIVQDKDKTAPHNELRAVGKAVLDTGNYSVDFISYSMIESLNAMHLCYPALKAITVCSGLDGTCYNNNESIDLNILFHSYDGECHSISLPMRVIRKSTIDILLCRDTVNKYDFWTLTPFAFGISPQLSAINKEKSDARRREFERKEALDKLDPLYRHKYTRSMISKGPEPETVAYDSITPHYDDLKSSYGKHIRNYKRGSYGLTPYPNKKMNLLLEDAC